MALVNGPERCVQVADRESDIYELFCLAPDLGTSLLVKVQTNRLPNALADAVPEQGGAGKDDTDRLTHSSSNLFASVSVSPRTFNSGLRSPR
jgi:hypothetical protein